MHLQSPTPPLGDLGLLRNNTPEPEGMLLDSAAVPGLEELSAAGQESVEVAQVAGQEPQLGFQLEQVWKILF